MNDGIGARVLVTPHRRHIPPEPAGAVRRGRLVAGRVGARPVTLVCAPAGAGKTVLVADWARRSARHGEAVAWLALEPRDDRPDEFWSALLAALAEAATGDSRAHLDALSPPHDGEEAAFVTTLRDVVTRRTPVRRLVLDDVHHLRTPAVLRALDTFLAGLPPELRIVLVSRSDPVLALHRRRLDGTLAEVRGTDLAFTDDEAAELLTALGTPLPAADVSRIVARTEGWAAGLRLAQVTLAAVGDPATFIAAFEGDQRAVADYLFAEIVQYLPVGLHEFLLSTCVPEQLTVELAAHLSGRADAGDLLDRLSRENALVTGLADTSGYRYHGLLRSYLASTLAHRDAAAPRRQHAAAARWFATHGNPAAALDHAARAGDDGHLAELLRIRGPAMILSGRARLVTDTVDAAGPAVRDDVAVATVAALAALDLPDLASADARLAKVDALGPSREPRVAALRCAAVVERALADGDVGQALASTGLLGLESTGDADVDLLVLHKRAPARMRGGDYACAIGDLERALRLARAGRYDQFVLSTMSQLAGLTGAASDFAASRGWALAAIEFATPRGWASSPRLAYAYAMAAWTSFLTGDDSGQARYAGLGLRSVDDVNNAEVELGVRSMYWLAAYEAASGRARHRAVEAFHDVWRSPLAERVSPMMVGSAVGQLRRVTVAVGEHAWANEATDLMERLLPQSAEACTARGSLVAARGRAAEARRMLEPVLHGDLPMHVPTTAVYADVLAATLDAEGDRTTHAFDELRRALDRAAPQNFRRPFIDSWKSVLPMLVAHQGRFGRAEGFVADLLRALPRQSAATGHQMVAPTLTQRESELLRDLPSPMSVQEIADARGVSLNTVKTHLGSVYRKLGVSRRRGAVLEARRRGLL
ncbi:LuxR C-terminal-related transcriptional regulator [Myceligenerans cantabricum]